MLHVVCMMLLFTVAMSAPLGYMDSEAESKLISTEGFVLQHAWAYTPHIFLSLVLDLSDSKCFIIIIQRLCKATKGL